MRSYTVHAPPGDPAPERFAFVKDGFAWPAFFFTLVWILWHRMWLTLIGIIIFVLVIAWIGRLAGDTHATIFAIAGALLIGLEGNTIRRLSLENRGWREIGGASGRNLTEAEIGFFHEWTNASARRRDERPQRAFTAKMQSAPAGEEPILGLFPEPER